MPHICDVSHTYQAPYLSLDARKENGGGHLRGISGMRMMPNCHSAELQNYTLPSCRVADKRTYHLRTVVTDVWLKVLADVWCHEALPGT